MTLNLTDSIALDNNVFMHCGHHHPDFNPDGHIEILLSKLIGASTKLLVDSKNHIRKEYNRFIQPMIQNSSQTGTQLEILKYWMNPDNQHKVEINPQGALMTAIERVLPGNEQKEDRTYVAVAFASGRMLVSNDVKDIIDGPDRELSAKGPRRDRLLREARKHREEGSDIQMTNEAHRHFCVPGSEDPCQSTPEASTS